MTTLSLIMIVKNEEKVLEKCLKSIHRYVDEIVIVDTGSEDGTKEIAKKYNSKIYDFKWVKDFSKARNFAKSKATSEWLLQLDADEYMIEEQAEKIKNEIEKTERNGLLVHITNLVNEQKLGVSHPYVRIFRNRDQIQYQGRIHEQVLFDGQAIDADDTTIRIVHSGYTKEKMDEKRKHQRNFELLRLEYKDNPEDAYVNLNLSNQYLSNQEYDKTIYHAQISFKNGEGMNFRHKAFSNIIYALIGLEEYKKALETIQDAQAVYVQFTDLWYLQGRVLEHMERNREAEKSYLKCLSMGESPTDYQSLVGVGSYLPLEQLMTISFKYREFEKAIRYLTVWMSIKKYDQDNCAFSFKLMKNYLKNEDIVLNFIDKLYPDNDEKNLFFKFKLYQIVRSKKGFQRVNKALKKEYKKTPLTQMLLEDYDGAKKEFLKIEKMDQEQLQNGIVLWSITKDEEIKNKIITWDSCTNYIINHFEGKEDTRNYGKLNADLYMSVIWALNDLEEYVLMEKLIKDSISYPSFVNKQLFELFYTKLDDELALVFLNRYMLAGNVEKDELVIAATLLFSLGEYEQSLKFADALKEKNTFRYYELEIENMEKMEKIEEVQDLCIEAIEKYDGSDYIIEKMEALI